MLQPPILGSPILGDNNNLRHSPIMPFTTRAMTLPDISEGGGAFQRLFSDAPNPPLDGPITFLAPELAAETLLEVRGKHFMRGKMGVGDRDLLGLYRLSYLEQEDDPLLSDKLMLQKIHSRLRKKEAKD
ncbi:unnamed protein product, partial [Timema podura]|nr:unnamed protein product [Timema podura]